MKPRTLLVPEAKLRLVFTSDHMPGYTRTRRGRGFAYRLPDGGKLADSLEIARIRSLAVPPAYRDVWICQLANGHLQATGIDARGRKQYRYHPAWHGHAADRKFTRLLAFLKVLPKLRAAVRRELQAEDLTRSRVIAGIVRLLDETGYRIGSPRYVKENGSYGLSSLLSRHLKEEDGVLRLKFRGKAGALHEAEVTSPLLASLVAELQELPGQHLFSYETEDGTVHDLGTGDVNQWLHEVSGEEITAKQFRTWKATLLCARHLSAEPPPESAVARKAAVNRAIRETAATLNHTPATCRKYYIHPAILHAYETGELHRRMHKPAPRATAGTAGLHADERRVIALLATGSRTGKC